MEIGAYQGRDKPGGMVMMGWYKMFSGAALDAKWIVIGHLAQVAPGIVAAMAWAMLDHASKATPRGDVSGFDIESFALWSGFDIEECNAVQRCMLQKRFIENGQIANWDSYQGGRGGGAAMTSTERSRKHRENKKKIKHENSGRDHATDATLHATATPKIREERERETDKSVSLSSLPLPLSSGGGEEEGPAGGGSDGSGPAGWPPWKGKLAVEIGVAPVKTWFREAIWDPAGGVLTVPNRTIGAWIRNCYEQGLRHATGLSERADLRIVVADRARGSSGTRRRVAPENAIMVCAG